MDTPSGGGRDSRFNMGYNMSLLSGETTPEIYSSGVHSRPSTSITSGLSRSSLSLSSGCGAGLQRGVKRTSSDVCFEQDVTGGRSSMSGLTGECGSDIVDDGFSPTPQKGSPPSNGKKTKGRVKIKMEYIDNKLRRYTTFSKRKTGIMKKAYELSTLTGTQVMLLVASETGHVYTFATRKLQPMITSEAGKALIQTCLNSPDPCPSGSGGDQRMSATGFEETELSYNIGDDEQKEELSPEPGSGGDSSSSASPEPPRAPPITTGHDLSVLHQQLSQAASSPAVLMQDSRRTPPPSCVPVALVAAPAHQNTRSTTAPGRDRHIISVTEETPTVSNEWSYGGIHWPESYSAKQDDSKRFKPSDLVERSSETPVYKYTPINTFLRAGLVSSSSFPTVMYQTPQGMVYATPSPTLPNGVILSLGREQTSVRPGQPQFITIPLPLGLTAPTTTAAPAQAAAADLSKAKK